MPTTQHIVPIAVKIINKCEDNVFRSACLLLPHVKCCSGLLADMETGYKDFEEGSATSRRVGRCNVSANEIDETEANYPHSHWLESVVRSHLSPHGGRMLRAAVASVCCQTPPPPMTRSLRDEPQDGINGGQDIVLPITITGPHMLIVNATEEFTAAQQRRWNIRN